MFTYMQIAVLGIIAAYLSQRQSYLRRRNLLTPESFIEQLRKSPVDSERLWDRLQDARLVMEILDFADRNGNSSQIDRNQLQALRKDAMECRIHLVAEMARSVVLIRAQ
jgi:hypothetical protein